MSGRPALAAGLLLLALQITGCRAREDEFFSQVFPCQQGQSCGTNRQGEPMMCLDTRQLGAHDFCTDTCNPDAGPENDEEGFTCLASGARLRQCRPSLKEKACPPGLRCLRTDLFVDYGLCMDVPVCNGDGDCMNAGHGHDDCAVGVLRDAYGVETDSMFCLKANCQRDHSSCANEEVCLKSVLTTINSAPDICVPDCDSNGHCPPNFVCSRNVYGRLSPQACVPGVPGYRCERAIDCLVGTCEEAGTGVKQCALPCVDDSTCAALNTANDYYACVSASPEAVRHCVLLNDLSGTACETTADCLQPGQQCFPYIPYGARPTGECRFPCDASDGTCASRGGVPHVCLGSTGGCYPGRFALPCTADDQCTVNLRCLTPSASVADASAPDGGPIGPIGPTCTVPCSSDADCAANHWIGPNEAYCAGEVCLRRVPLAPVN